MLVPKSRIENINPFYPVQNKMPSLRIKQVVQLLQHQSIPVIWEQALKCPCINIQTGQPKPNCPICHGQGWLYLHPRSLDIAIQGDHKNFNLSTSGADEMGTSLATPQITINGIEQGIKPGDRLTVPGWTTNESYTFNINQSRLENGIFLPYDVQSINEAYTIQHNQLQPLNLDKDLILKHNFVQIANPDLIDNTITLSLEIVKRFYVISLSKELRYQRYTRLADKQWATGNGRGGEATDSQSSAQNNAQSSSDSSQSVSSSSSVSYTRNGQKLTESITSQSNTNPIDSVDDGNGDDNSESGDKLQDFPQVVHRDGNKIVVGKDQIYRMPPLLVIRRENLYFSNINLVSHETDNHAMIHDPRITEFNNFVGNGDNDGNNS